MNIDEKIAEAPCYSSMIPGWRAIIEQLDLTLEYLVPGYQVIQVKEKFGGLRYYVELPKGVTDEQWEKAYAVIEYAENLSYRVCADCGAPGKETQIGYLIATLCQTCEEARVEERRQRFANE